MDNLNLKDFVVELKKGNLDVFDKFYQLVKNQVFYNIVSITKSYELSEDLLQDTFVSFLKNIDKIDENSSILGYLMVTSRNITLDYFKKNNRLEQVEEMDSDLSTVDQSNVDRDILLNKIEKILKEKEFEIFTLHVLSELSFDEISKLLKRPLGTILWSYNNSIKKLQKELKYEKD